MKNKFFTKEFLDRLQENCGALTMVNHYINDLGMSFHDAILRFSNHHSMTPEYCDNEYQATKPDVSDYNFITMMSKNES